MSHAELEPASTALRAERELLDNPFVGGIARVLLGLNRVMAALCGIAIVVASLVLTYSVIVRYALHAPTYWQDEASVFLLVGATFLSAAHIQAGRGHVGIEALVSVLSPAVNRVRYLLVDVASFAFCAFFAWKSWTLLHEAWVDGQTSSSTWGPPLWIPYSFMAVGMTLLALQLLLQVVAFATGGRRA